MKNNIFWVINSFKIVEFVENGKTFPLEEDEKVAHGWRD